MSRKRNKNRGHFPREALDAQTAIDIADSADLPDGAYFAMIGDLMGGDYMTGVDAVIGYTGPVAHEITKAERAALEAFGEIRVCSEWHFQIRAKGGKPILADWWPHRTKFRLAGGSRTEMGDGLYLAKQLKRALERNNKPAAGLTCPCCGQIVPVTQ